MHQKAAGVKLTHGAAATRAVLPSLGGRDAVFKPSRAWADNLHMVRNP